MVRRHLLAWVALGMAVIGMASVGRAAPPADTADSLRAVVEASADRLALAHQVALSKWDSGAAVEDGGREAVVIMNAVSQGEGQGLERIWVASVFRAQIEANKLVQYGLIADWGRSGAAPDHAPIDLVRDVRPQLDTAQKALMAALPGVAPLRTRKTCRAEVAAAVNDYLYRRQLPAGTLDAIALDRAMVGVCGG
ncbi:chorismate mutase [Nitrospirillum viridazoti]|uniref:chorismate mutase n=1 Tax=Nitrospirillum amazonense TaxID=28077 RepID=A0A560IEY8_9PROT|nr:chorismate mutase [Nitrospirillum amazonense]TWB56589.1 chorismate mutase [Nitrospirillum amazonense]